MNRVIACMLACMFLAGLTVTAASSGDWTGPSFREFSGVNQGKPEGPLWDHALGWTRQVIAWQKCEPKQGKWDQAYLENYGKLVLAFKERGIQVMPLLCYDQLWAADRSARTYDFAYLRWRIAPSDGGKFGVTALKKNAKGGWDQTKKSTVDVRNTWPPAPEHVKDWANYVRRVVSFLSKPPYNVEYFQVWNEAHPLSPFWMGDLDTYMDRIHLPAAKVIHGLGGKVVYGGWPTCASPKGLIGMLDQHDAWDSVDVLDVHYLDPAALDSLNDEALKRGQDKDIWESEIGFTTDPGYIGSFYPVALSWALANKWNRPDKFKVFYFTYWSPDSPKAYGYKRTLYTGGNLSAHGQSLRTLGELLDGPNLRTYRGVWSKPELADEIDLKKSGLQSFAVGDRVVVAIHNRGLGSSNVTVTVPRLKPDSVVKVERCDLSGIREDITSAMKSTWNGVKVTVPVDDDAGSPVAKWWTGKGKQTRTFFVVFRLNKQVPS